MCPTTPSAVDDTHFNTSVQSVLTSKRVGTPVFVRLLLQGPDTGDALLTKLARLGSVAQGWIGREVVRCQASGTLEGGQVTALLTFTGGAMALVSYARGPVVGDGFDAMVLGNHGAIYHDGGAANLWDAALTVTTELQGPVTKDLLRRALEAGKPLAIGQGGSP